LGMNIDVTVALPSQIDTPLLVLPWCQGREQQAERAPRELEPLDEALGLTLTRAVAGGDFRGGRGRRLSGTAGRDATALPAG